MGSGPSIPKIETDAKAPIEVALGPLHRFSKMESAGGILLILFAAAAMVWANSPAASSYIDLFQKTYVQVGFGDRGINKPFILWINDLLMAVFFLLVGLEIKREILVGELRSPKAAALPIAAAIGGMAFPGAIYAAVNWGQEGINGWGIPMATDIAFALGVMALLGSRVPIALKVFLTSLAIVDDLGALMIIAIFYTDTVGVNYLVYAAILLAFLFGLNFAGVRSRLVYLLAGLVVWYFFLKSGVHATIAGVLVALTIPGKTKVDRAAFVSFADRMLDTFRKEGTDGGKVWTTPTQQGSLLALEDATAKVETPLRSLEHKLIPWVAFLILPVFALANAGVALGGSGGEGEASVFTSRVLIGVALGLLIGKPLGVFVCSWIAVKIGVASMPKGVNWGMIHGAGWLSGIGFTMALFIANLGFKGEENAFMLDAAKLGVLGASVLAGVIGLILLARATSKPPA
ncbi:MAG: Na+/H+ antiporter NhaA [Planctomycetota bacterium]